MTFSREQVHADQIARLRDWASGQGHQPDTYRVRPPRQPGTIVDPRGTR